MSYLQRLGLGTSNYDKRPFIAVQGYDESCWQGWDSIITQLRLAIDKLGKTNALIAMECYTGLYDDEIIEAILAGLKPERLIQTEETVFKDEKAIDAMVAPELGGDDPVFGRISRLSTIDFLDKKKRLALEKELSEVMGLCFVYGPGSILCCDPDLVVYADMPRREGQLRQRRNEVRNLGVSNQELNAKLQYKRSFFIDWRVSDKLKRETYGQWDFILDSCVRGEPKLVTGEAFRAGLEQATKRPFRVVPFFDPGVWGGQWMKEVFSLPDGPPNYAWCFDCVPEENSLLLDFGGVQFETPSLNLVFRHPEELLGEPVYGMFGAEFPIRFDFLDTMQGQNLSFQVHPLLDYAYEHFGLRYTQDESYYLLDVGEGAEVFLGLNDDVDPMMMLADLEAASKDAAKPFPDHEYVARFPANKHDHFLIPAGTCHCSGAGSMVLEISHTPYIFTFKMWDWDRVDLDGQPRPINLERATANILWDRNESWVRDNLVNQFEQLASGDGWREERTGLYKSEFIETRRHWFSGKAPHDTKGESVHVLNLIEGAEAVVESPTSAFDPFVVHYAETIIVPATIGAYTVRPYGESVGRECATLKAFIRVNS